MKTLVIAGLLFFNLNSFALTPKITSSNPTAINAGMNLIMTLYGENLFPAMSKMDNDKDVEVSVRKVGLTMSPWMTASHNFQDGNGPNGVPTISLSSPTMFQIQFPDYLTKDAGSLQFIICVRTSGCSNMLSIPVYATNYSGNVSINNAGPIDTIVPTEGFPITIMMDVAGLTGYSPKLKINGQLVEGYAQYQQNRVWFYLDNKAIPKAGIYDVRVLDTYAGESGGSIMIRAFGDPSVLSAAPAQINQSLGSVGKPQDASVQFTFEPFTVPSKIVVIDAFGVGHTLNPPIDLFTFKANVSIPGAWLKAGTYDLRFEFTNVSGTVAKSLPVNISQIIYQPIPRPIPNPIPLPRPIPRPVK